jgi:hypothetical protein
MTVAGSGYASSPMTSIDPSLERRREQRVHETLDPGYERLHSARREHLRDELP